MVGVLCCFAAAGTIFIVATELQGKYTLRFAVGNARTQLEHVRYGWQIIQQEAEKVLASINTATAAK